ncbi:MAG TPA: hypothetical protein VMQ62_10475, partial [Dongiaceae bacterium]|nr:hypothetical protein [Dongiaceae bacterium]
GGGSAPASGVPTTLLALRGPGISARALGEALRRQPVPVIARIEAGSVLLDLRTVAPDEEPLLEAAVIAAAGGEAMPAAVPAPRR